ncbi:hypothetical protein Emed_001950 [Eimeria media]
MFVKAPGEAVLPVFLRNQAEALEQFKVFVANYKAELKGGEEEDEKLRERMRRWTLYKLQMAILANMEVAGLEQLDRLSQSVDNEQAVQEAKAKLKETYQFKTSVSPELMAARW